MEVFTKVSTGNCRHKKALKIKALIQYMAEEVSLFSVSRVVPLCAVFTFKINRLYNLTVPRRFTSFF